MQLMCCEMVIASEIEQGVPRRDVALTYAMAIESAAAGRPTDWGTINAAIVAKWGARGLSAVKNRAWKIISLWHRQ
jgi:hypothetical protein